MSFHSVYSLLILTWRNHRFVSKIYSVLFYVQDFLGLFNSSTAVRHHEIRLVLVHLDHFGGLGRQIFVRGMQMCPAFLHRRPFSSFAVLDFLTLDDNLMAVYYLDWNDTTRILQSLMLPKGEKPRLLGRFTGYVPRCSWWNYSLGQLSRIWFSFSLSWWICWRGDDRQTNFIDSRSSIVIFCILIIAQKLLFCLRLFENSTARFGLLLSLWSSILGKALSDDCLGCIILIIKMNSGSFTNGMRETVLSMWTSSEYFVLRFRPF